MSNITTISILPIEEIRIIKQIMIISEYSKKQEFSIGYILYERELSNTYNFKGTEKEERDFLYYLEYPRQNTFPNDNLDEIILQAIRNTFPKSTLRNYSLICNMDRDRITMLQSEAFKEVEITFTPDFSRANISEFAGQNYDGLRKTIKIYSDLTKERLQNIYFQGYYNLIDKQILGMIDKIKFS